MDCPVNEESIGGVEGDGNMRRVLTAKPTMVFWPSVRLLVSARAFLVFQPIRPLEEQNLSQAGLAEGVVPCAL